MGRVADEGCSYRWIGQKISDSNFGAEIGMNREREADEEAFGRSAKALRQEQARQIRAITQDTSGLSLDYKSGEVGSRLRCGTARSLDPLGWRFSAIPRGQSHLGYLKILMSWPLCRDFESGGVQCKPCGAS